MHKRAEPQSLASGRKGNSKRREGSKKSRNDQVQDGDEEDEKDSRSREEEFVREMRELLDWCGRVVVPALNESFAKG